MHRADGSARVLLLAFMHRVTHLLLDIAQTVDQAFCFRILLVHRRQGIFLQLLACLLDLRLAHRFLPSIGHFLTLGLKLLHYLFSLGLIKVAGAQFFRQCLQFLAAGFHVVALFLNRRLQHLLIIILLFFQTRIIFQRFLVNFLKFLGFFLILMNQSLSVVLAAVV